ncbi:MAG: hypothetical protein Kow00109_06590 [Acidobacteriota bacterium]
MSWLRIKALLGAAVTGWAASWQPARVQVAATEVKVPVVVMDKEGKVYGNLPASAFQVFENDQPREILNFTGAESNLTVLLLLEHSRISQYLLTEVLRPAAIFATQVMEPGDYAAIVAFDLRPRVLQDFTRQRQALLNTIDILYKSPPAYSESNLFDAVAFALRGGELDGVEYKGLAEVEGRTGLLVVATGVDTFSKINLDEARRIAANSGVPVYSIGVGELAYIRAEPYLSGLQRLNYLQARNNLQALSRESGGRYYAVRFEAALDDVLQSIGTMLRLQCVLTYRPAPGGGKRREIRVEVDVDGDGRPDTDRLDLQYRRYFYPEEVKK